MASGYGLSGGTSRCFPFWQELLACYVINSSDEDSSGLKKCAPAMEDYYECLHHRKEAARTKAIQNAYRKALQGHPRERQPNASQIRNLGLLGKDEESRAFLTKFVDTSEGKNGKHRGNEEPKGVVGLLRKIGE